MNTEMKYLPNDIIIKICKQNKINKQNTVWRKRHNLMIKHLEEYVEEHGDLNPSYVMERDIRCDVRFMEYNEAWDTTLGECILELHGGEEYVEEWCDNNF